MKTLKKYIEMMRVSFQFDESKLYVNSMKEILRFLCWVSFLYKLLDGLWITRLIVHLELKTWNFKVGT